QMSGAPGTGAAGIRPLQLGQNQGRYAGASAALSPTAYWMGRQLQGQQGADFPTPNFRQPVDDDLPDSSPAIACRHARRGCRIPPCSVGRCVPPTWAEHRHLAAGRRGGQLSLHGGASTPVTLLPARLGERSKAQRRRNPRVARYTAELWGRDMKIVYWAEN